MNLEKSRNRLLETLEIAPEIKAIMISDGTVEAKRWKIKMYLAHLTDDVIEHDADIPALEWIVVRNAVNVLRKLLSKRNEELAGFSLIGYIDSLLDEKKWPEIEPPTRGFFAEFKHLMKGIMGTANLYADKVPEFSLYEGRKAARRRSGDLSRIGKDAQRLMARYPNGLDKDAVKRRSVNKHRILKYFGDTEYEWESSHWHVKHIIRDADTLAELVKLTDEQYEAVRLANELKVPFGITPYYLSLMDYKPDVRDYAVRAQVIPTLKYVRRMHEMRQRGEESMDFMLECDTSPIDGITRRYPMIVILKPILTCPQICVYCQRNWEISGVNDKEAVLTKEKLEKAIDWIADHPTISEVLVTGGDPFMLSNRRLESLLFKLTRIDHVKRIRIGTRTPVTLPQRVTDSLVGDINHFHSPGHREICIVTHFEHPYEITPQSTAAVQKFRRFGMEVLNQMVYTFYNSRRFEACALRDKLRMIGVTPYYTFNTKGKEETDDYRVPIARLLQEQKEEARLLPGTTRTDEVVFNVPGLGKNSVSSGQHHDLIALLPDGRRVYEFHPWEKKLTLVDTYIYKDVSIHDYLRRMAASGEDTRKYRSIWYYY